jgi:hypothetical protein
MVTVLLISGKEKMGNGKLLRRDALYRPKSRKAARPFVYVVKQSLKLNGSLIVIAG